jgi:hypothetical protein
MVQRVSTLPKLIPRLDIRVAGGKEFQFTAMIFKRDEEPFEVEDLLDVIKRAHDELSDALATDDGRVEILEIRSSPVELPADPLVRIGFHLLKGVALDYALAEALDWNHPLGGKLSFQHGVIMHTNSTADFDKRGQFNPQVDMRLAVHFIDAYNLDISWREDKNDKTKKNPSVSSFTHFHAMIEHSTLPMATTFYMLQKNLKSHSVEVPLSLLHTEQ